MKQIPLKQQPQMVPKIKKMSWGVSVTFHVVDNYEVRRAPDSFNVTGISQNDKGEWCWEIDTP